MNNQTKQDVYDIITSLFKDSKGIFAADESPTSLNKRFNAVGISEDVESRRNYRELLISTPDFGKVHKWCNFS